MTTQAGYDSILQNLKSYPDFDILTLSPDIIGHVMQLEYNIKKETSDISEVSCGADGTRTRDPRRDRPVF